ncbi:MAG: hypothetical protein JRG94_20210, partial [Deltaproteobacteria bacterium]|nr:hypothetical protein [Deltaproteobacteria bacterium]
ALTAMSSWLVLGGAIGVGYLFRGAKPVLARLCFLAFLTEALLVCSYYIMEMRYQVDLIPMFIFGYGMFLAEVSARGPLRGRTKDLASGLVFAVAVSAIVSISCTLSAIPLGGPAHPSSYKADWQERFRAVDARMPG